jgi:hypothetical protein
MEHHATPALLPPLQYFAASLLQRAYLNGAILSRQLGLHCLRMPSHGADLWRPLSGVQHMYGRLNGAYCARKGLKDAKRVHCLGGVFIIKNSSKGLQQRKPLQDIRG